MAFSFVQSASNASTGSTNAIIVKAFTSNITSGNALFAIVQHYNASATITITDTRSSTWTQVGSGVSQGSTIYSRLFYATAPSSGSCTVTATFTTNGQYCGLAIMEFSGFGTLALQGSGQSATGNSTSPSLNFSTTSADTLVIVSYMSNSGGSASFTGATIAERTSFSTTFQSNIAAYDINISSGSQTYSCTQSSGHWLIQAAEFYDSGGGPTSAVSMIGNEGGLILVA